MNKGIHVFFLLSLALLWACSTEEGAEKKAVFGNDATQSLLGNWNASESYRGENLELKDDGEFVYGMVSCMSNNFASGTWRLEDSLLILNSFPEHDPQRERPNFPTGSFKSHGNLEAADQNPDLEIPPLWESDTIFFKEKSFLIVDSELLSVDKQNPHSLKKIPKDAE